MNKAIVKVSFYFCLIQMTTGVDDHGCDLHGIPENIEEDIQFFLYTRDDVLNPINMKLEQNNNEGTSFNPGNPTVLYVHGFTQTSYSKSSQEVKDAYMHCGNYNVIVMDWGLFGLYPHYNAAVNFLPMIGKYAALMIKSWEGKGMISLPQLHIIGNSLGAHISGIIGEELAKLGNEKIGRITGLDPAGPKFEKRRSPHGMLDKEDANFVDVIHTDTRMFGIKRPIGHVDFYVNGGKSQPGCVMTQVACSHRRAREYYVESILNPHGFPAYRCDSWQRLNCFCQTLRKSLMGFAAHHETMGIFTVKTRTSYPFATRTNSYSKIVPCGISSIDVHPHSLSEL